MKLFLVEKHDVCGKHNAKYIVQAATESEALEKVNLAKDDLQLFQIRGLNGEESFSRFTVTVEEIEFNQDGFYLFDY